jgi:hypothetical protein
MKMLSNKLWIQSLMGMSLLGFVGLASAQAQQADIQYWRPNDQRGLNVYEAPKADSTAYQGLRVRVGGDFAMQFQGISQSNDLDNLAQLGSNFNLPSANLNLDVQLLDGVRMHMRTYMSSRHHAEAWIKGGHIQMDNLNFVKPGFLDHVMQYASITIGLDEFNYGDAHFRRSDNARAIFNPFVGNYIMDAFSTEAFGEVTLQKNGWLGVLGMTNGKLNQNVIVNDNSDNQPSLYAKLGFDKQLKEDLRVRLTGSVYRNHGATTGTWLYGGDRAGSRYYQVLWTVDPASGAASGSNFDGRYNARFTKVTALQVNPFFKYKGLEFFGIYEWVNGANTFEQPMADTEGAFTQIAGELLYRFGAKEDFYLAGRYNTVSGKMRESFEDNNTITRLNIGGGWFMSRNILAKIEYVNQQYTGDAWTGKFAGASFSGIVAEAVVSF